MPIRIETEVTKTEALRALATTEMKDFDEADWGAFAGCETENPLIGHCKINNADHVLVLDGEQLLVMEVGDISGGVTFHLKECYV